MKKRDFGMAGSDYTGTKIALSFALKGLTFPNYFTNEKRKSIGHKLEARK